MTKKSIIELLKTYRTATVAFNGLASIESVDTDKHRLIGHYTRETKRINTEHPGAGLVMTVTDDKIGLNNGQFVWLPKYPRFGPIVVKSKEFSIDGVYFKFVDIIADSYTETDKTVGFQLMSGNHVLLTK